MKNLLTQEIENKYQNLTRNLTAAFYMFIVFVIVYICIFGLYYIWYFILHNASNDLFLFLTSPFGPIENLSPIYSSLQVGFIWNGIEVGVALAILTFYFNTSFKGYKKYIGPYFVLLYSILASYITSAIIWILDSSPSTGTSIIGASSTIFIILMFTFGAIKAVRKSKIKFCVLCIFIIITLILLLAFYFLGNKFWYVHLIGLVIFSSIILLVNFLDKHLYYLHKIDTKTLNSISVVFIFIVISFGLFYIINSKLYYLDSSIPIIPIMLLTEVIIAIVSVYRANKLTLNYVFDKRQASELNPIARILYNKFGKSTITFTFIFVALLSLFIYLMYYYIIFLRPVTVEIFMPILMMVTFGDWLNDEIKGLFIRKRLK